MKKKSMFIISVGVLSIGMLVGCSNSPEGEPTDIKIEAPSSGDLPGSDTNQGETGAPESSKGTSLEGQDNNIQAETKDNQGTASDQSKTTDSLDQQGEGSEIDGEKTDLNDK